MVRILTKLKDGQIHFRYFEVSGLNCLLTEPEGNCVSATNTITGIIGWWDGTSASLSQIDQCRLEDFPAGLHAIKFRPIRDNRHPDEVKFYNK